MCDKWQVAHFVVVDSLDKQEIQDTCNKNQDETTLDHGVL